jgi:hypothetical protein
MRESERPGANLTSRFTKARQAVSRSSRWSDRPPAIGRSRWSPRGRGKYVPLLLKRPTQLSARASRSIASHEHSLVSLPLVPLAEPGDRGRAEA